MLPADGSANGQPTKAPPSEEWKGAAVSRSTELLKCARTALRIEQQKLRDAEQNDHPLLTWTDAMLELHSRAAPQSVSGMLEDGCTLLRGMQFGLKQLQGLVRRRGHTNDPTEQIAQLTRQLEQDTQELTSFIQAVQKVGLQNRQSKKHWQLVATWFQQVAASYGAQMKDILKLRGSVLAEQAQRRRLVVSRQHHPQNSNGTANKHGSRGDGTGNGTFAPAAKHRTRRPLVGSSAAATPLFDSPLFSDAPSSGSANTRLQNTFQPPAGSSKQTNNASAYDQSGMEISGHGSASSGGYGGGYGGVGSNPAAFGMRHRRGGTSSASRPAPHNGYYDNDHDKKKENESQAVQMQIQEREQRRQTAQRLAEAQQAEKQLGELGHLFGKMSTLISEQGEVLEKIEDDVEAALVDVEAGQEQLTILHGIKKGNRPLIIKVFLILNFLIVFMKFYKK